MAPSIKRLKIVATQEGDENTPPAAAGSFSSTAVTCSQGVALGGLLGVGSSSFGPSSAAHTSLQHHRPQQFKVGRWELPFHFSCCGCSPVGMSDICYLLFLQCPLPYSQQTQASRGSLGAKKSYSGGADLLAALQRRVVLSEPRQQHAETSNTVSELVLYDPEEHRQQWAAQQETATNTLDPVTADASPQLEPTATQPGGPMPPTAAPAPTSTAGAVTAAGTANMGWEKRVKVYADPFLVEKLRPHQKEGVK